MLANTGKYWQILANTSKYYQKLASILQTLQTHKATQPPLGYLWFDLQIICFTTRVDANKRHHLLMLFIWIQNHVYDHYFVWRGVKILKCNYDSSFFEMNSGWCSCWLFAAWYFTLVQIVEHFCLKYDPVFYAWWFGQCVSLNRFAANKLMWLDQMYCIVILYSSPL